MDTSGGIADLFRYPVKGLRPEALTTALLREAAGIEGDRAFAFQFIDDGVPEALKTGPAENAPWLSKAHLAVQHDWPELARLVPRWNASRKTLRLELDSTAIEESVIDPQGRIRLSEFVRRFLETTNPYAKARRTKPAELRLLGNANLGGIYTDSANGFVSLGLLESLADLESKFDGSIDRRRFRLNFYLEGAPAWSELDWVGREIQLGPCRLRVVKAIGRCPNIDVDPDTGKRCSEIFPRLKKNLGHAFFGVRGAVIEAGCARVGDPWKLI